MAGAQLRLVQPSRLFVFLNLHALASPFNVDRSDFGTLGESELLAALRALTTLDHVLLLEEEGLNEVGRLGGP